MAIVGIDTVHTDPSIHALVSRAVVHVGLTVLALEAWQAGALVGVITNLVAGSPVEALGGGAGEGRNLAGAPAVPRFAAARERAQCVLAHTPVEAAARLATFVHVIAAVLALEARRARAVVMIVPVGTAGTIGTRA